MESNKKLKIRKKNGCIQTIPLYTDKKDIASQKKLAIRVGDVKLYAELVPPDSDYASSLRCRSGVVLAARKQDKNMGKDAIHLTNKRHVLLYEEEKEKAIKESIEGLTQEYASADAAAKEDISKRLIEARALADAMRFEQTFYHQNLDGEVPNDLDITGVDNTSYMYSGLDRLEKLQPLNLSKSKDMRCMFERCKTLPSVFPYVVDLSSIENLLSLQGMFQDSSVWKVYCTNVQDKIADSLPEAKQQIGAQALIAIPLSQDKYKMSDLFPTEYTTKASFPSQYCCLGMTSLAGIFKGCMSMTSVHKMETSWIKDFREAFYGCCALPERFPFVIDINGVQDAEMLRNMFKDSSVNTIEFSTCNQELLKKITPELLGKTVDVRASINVSNAHHKMSEALPDKYQTMTRPYAHLKIDENFHDATEMYKGCSALMEIDDEALTSAQGITEAKGMFQGCSSLVKAPVVNLSGCRDLSDVFYGCESLKDIRYIPTRKAKNFDSMLYGCKSLPKKLLWMIDARTVGYANAFHDMLLGTPVEELMLVNLDESIRKDIKFSSIGENLKQITYYASVDWIWSDSKERYQKDFDKIVLWDENRLSKLSEIETVSELRFEGMKVVSGCIGQASNLRSIGSITGTENVKSMCDLFIGCHNLTSVPAIDVSSITTVYALRGMFSETKVAEVHFKNAISSVKEQLTPEILGKADIKIFFD